MPDLLYEKRGRFAVFTMNRPERLNALGGTMMSDLAEALRDFNADPDMRAGILTGAGRAFSAGADLKEMNQRNLDRGEAAAPTRAFDPAASLPSPARPSPSSPPSTGSASPAASSAPSIATSASARRRPGSACSR